MSLMCGQDRSSASDAAGGGDDLAGQKACVVGCQEDRDEGDIVRLAGATQRGLRNTGLFCLRAYESARPGAFRHEKAGADGVDADAARTKFLGIGLGQHFQRAFRRAVDPQIRRREPRTDPLMSTMPAPSAAWPVQVLRFFPDTSRPDHRSIGADAANSFGARVSPTDGQTTAKMAVRRVIEMGGYATDVAFHGADDGNRTRVFSLGS
ncbi:MAG: hypothetical protein QOJ20_5711 [Mycobacterium sp.]|nr:hypothetical protein [Mycobacterium sp.]